MMCCPMHERQPTWVMMGCAQPIIAWKTNHFQPQRRILCEEQRCKAKTNSQLNNHSICELQFTPCHSTLVHCFEQHFGNMQAAECVCFQQTTADRNSNQHQCKGVMQGCHDLFLLCGAGSGKNPAAELAAGALLEGRQQTAAAAAAAGAKSCSSPPTVTTTSSSRRTTTGLGAPTRQHLGNCRRRRSR